MNTQRFLLTLLVTASAAMAFAQAREIAKWDPAMASNNAKVDTNGVKWIDGKFLPIEGRAFDDVEFYYDRLPAGVTTNVNGGVRSMKHNTSGMLFRFKTDSDFLIVRYTPFNPSHGMMHMTEVGASGFDVYRFDEAAGNWKFAGSSHLVKTTEKPNEKIKRFSWKKGEECIINLPLYNGVKEFALGIAKDATVSAPAPHRSGIEKPVVFYGTSITHGGCSTRPGLGFVNIVGRHLNVPVVGLGFSGSGVMEYEMSEHLARIDASCYILDCLWNMSLYEKQRPGRAVETNYEPFIRNLQAKRPGVPIIMAEQCDVFCHGRNDKDTFIRKLYEKLKAEDARDGTKKWAKLYYLPKDKMYTGDTEGTVDGCHPNDLGMMSMANAFGGAVKEALGL